MAKDDEYQAIRNAPTPEDQRRLFLDFWNERDPSPGTVRNEQMEQYYFRVAYANERYSRFHDRGWNTDRGEIFIVFGEPDYVENHPFNYGTRPYQIWNYYGQGRRFIFVDDTGLGDFRLLVPRWDPPDADVGPGHARTLRAAPPPTDDPRPARPRRDRVS